MLALEPAVDNDGRLLMSQITFETGSNTYLLQVWVGDDVVERTDATCAELKLDDDDCFEILLQLVDQIRQRYELAIPVYVFVDGVETKVAIAIGFELRSELHNICSYTPPEERPRCMYRTLRTLWVVLGTRIAAGYHGLRLMNLTYEHLDSEGVIFAVPAAQIPPKGIGNVLKGYITALSVHRNSKIIAGTSILTNYDDVLVPHHIMSDEDKYRAQSIENFETWRWLVLAEETRHFPVQSKFRDGSRFGGILMNPRLINLFDRTVRIDLRFDSESVPSIVKERIFRGIDRLQFQGHILDQSNDVLSGITRPLLAVSVRSWSAVHEQSEGRRYDHQAYRECIKNAVLNYSIKSVLVAVDNPEMLLDEYVMYIQSLGVELSVHTVEYAAVDPLVKGVVELLALSQADIIIGDQLSTFVELAFWMGKGRAVFLRPYKEEIF